MRRWTVFVSTHSGLVLVLSGTIFLMSLFLVRELNVEAFPDPSAPVVEIVSIYEGKSAEEVERRITIPMEVGLAGMRERLLLLGGELEIESTPGKGTTILAWVPAPEG